MEQGTYEDGELVGAAQLPYYASIFQDRVFYVTSDPMRIVPPDMTVIGSDDPIPLGYAWDGTALSEPPKMYVALTQRQLRLALVRNGYSLDAVINAINTLEGQQRDEALIDWQYASFFERNNQTLIAVAQILGISDADIDTMWEAATAL